MNFNNRLQLVQALDEFLLHHTEEGDVGQVRDEGVTGSSTDSLTASEVQQSQRGETLQVGQTAVRQLTAAYTHTHKGTHILPSAVHVTDPACPDS